MMKIFEILVWELMMTGITLEITNAQRLPFVQGSVRAVSENDHFKYSSTESFLK